MTRELSECSRRRGNQVYVGAPDYSVGTCGDRRACGCPLSVRPGQPAPGSGGCSEGFWLEQAHPDQPAVIIDALDRVSAQIELAHDGGREVNPAGVQLSEGDRLLAGLAQPLEQPLLLGVSEHLRLG